MTNRNYVNGKGNANHESLEYTARELGYHDLSDLAHANGYSTPQEMAEKRGYKDITELLFGAPGAYFRLEALRK